MCFRMKNILKSNHLSHFQTHTNQLCLNIFLMLKKLKSAMPKYFSYIKRINLARSVTHDIYI
jgi:exonuclease I